MSCGYCFEGVPKNQTRSLYLFLGLSSICFLFRIINYEIKVKVLMTNKDKYKYLSASWRKELHFKVVFSAVLNEGNWERANRKNASMSSRASPA